MTIGFFLRAWRRIGAKLYPALGFAVFLTLVSSVVGVYYFKQSADASYEVRTESVPVLESSWAAAHEGEKLRTLGARGLTEDVPAESVQKALEKLDIELASVGAVPSMVPNRDEAREKAYELVAVIDNFSISRAGSLEADQLASQLRGRLASPESADFASVLQRMFLAEGQAGLEAVWQEFSGLPPSQADAAALGEEVFEVRAEQLLYAERTEELVASLHAASVALKVANSALLAEAQANSSETLQSSVTNFDRGRILLAVISIVRVGVATVTAWLLVGSGLVRSLTRLSERMRGMAGGDLETPVPGVGRDEIGEPAEALEVFPQQALEVQRLNLVETLYGELQEANAELQRVQDRLVAQEKLAALGELVSGVAHEISNPLNFVRNFAEVPVEMYEELTEVLGSYEDSMSEEDRTAIHDLEEDLADSLNRIRANCGRALAIVERMKGLGVVGGELTPVDLNSTVHSALEVGPSAFLARWPEFKLSVEYELDPSVGEVQIVEGDFGEAVVNLVSNACYAMWLRQSEGEEDGYQPRLLVSTGVEGDTIELKVRDNGTGISEDVLGHIFNPFFSTREGALGAGPGLSIAADVTRRAGGNLTVDSVYGEFAEFTMSLPDTEVSSQEPVSVSVPS